MNTFLNATCSTTDNGSKYLHIMWIILRVILLFTLPPSLWATMFWNVELIRGWLRPWLTAGEELVNVDGLCFALRAPVPYWGAGLLHPFLGCLCSRWFFKFVVFPHVLIWTPQCRHLAQSLWFFSICSQITLFRGILANNKKVKKWTKTEVIRLTSHKRMKKEVTNSEALLNWKLWKVKTIIDKRTSIIRLISHLEHQLQKYWLFN